MPLIDYPSVVRTYPSGKPSRTLTPPVNATDLRLVNPSRVTHISPATDDQITIDRAPSRWKLTITFGEMKSGSDLGNAFETFLALLEDTDNYADFPIGLRAPSWTGTTTISSIAGNALRTASSPPQGMKVGDFIRVGPRLGKIDALVTGGAGNEIGVLPRGLGAAGETISAGTHWRGRMAGAAQYSSPSSNGFIGPVTLDLNEVI